MNISETFPDGIVVKVQKNSEKAINNISLRYTIGIRKFFILTHYQKHFKSIFFNYKRILLIVCVWIHNITLKFMI